MKKLVLFKSSGCGPCKMFEPNIKSVAEKLGIDYVPIDVSTETGFNYATANAITHSGVAIYFIDDVAKMRWERPCAAEKLLNDINGLK